jgi:hypothetical protein
LCGRSPLKEVAFSILEAEEWLYSENGSRSCLTNIATSLPNNTASHPENLKLN